MDKGGVLAREDVAKSLIVHYVPYNCKVVHSTFEGNQGGEFEISSCLDSSENNTSAHRKLTQSNHAQVPLPCRRNHIHHTRGDAPDYIFVALVFCVVLPPVGFSGLYFGRRAQLANSRELYCDAWRYSNISFIFIEVGLICIAIIIVVCCVVLAFLSQTPSDTQKLTQNNTPMEQDTTKNYIQNPPDEAKYLLNKNPSEQLLRLHVKERIQDIVNSRTKSAE